MAATYAFTDLTERSRGGNPEAALPIQEQAHLADGLQPGYDYADEFEFGLDLILDGLDRLRAKH